MKGKIGIRRAENSLWANPRVNGIASLARLEEENRIMMFANVPRCSSESQTQQIVLQTLLWLQFVRWQVLGGAACRDGGEAEGEARRTREFSD